jgi:hypothetical protein
MKSMLVNIYLAAVKVRSFEIAANAAASPKIANK